MSSSATWAPLVGFSAPTLWNMLAVSFSCSNEEQVNRLIKSLSGKEQSPCHTNLGIKTWMWWYQVVPFEEPARVGCGLLANVFQPKEELNYQPRKNEDTSGPQEYLNPCLGCCQESVFVLTSSSLSLPFLTPLKLHLTQPWLLERNGIYLSTCSKNTREV